MENCGNRWTCVHMEKYFKYDKNYCQLRNLIFLSSTLCVQSLNPAVQVTTASPYFRWYGGNPLCRNPLDFCSFYHFEVCLQLSERHGDVSVNNHLVKQVATLVFHGFSQVYHVLKILVL